MLAGSQLSFEARLESTRCLILCEFVFVVCLFMCAQLVVFCRDMVLFDGTEL